MQIYSPNLKGPLKISGFVDPDDTTKISVFWGAPTFSPLTVYRNGDVTRPSIDNGYYYQCTTNGTTGSAEPVWGQEETVSGNVVFTAIPWNLWVLPSQSVVNSIWVSNDPNISLANTTFNDYKSSVFVSDIPDTLAEFELTNSIVKNNGESLSRSFLYKVNQQ